MKETIADKGSRQFMLKRQKLTEIKFSLQFLRESSLLLISPSTSLIRSVGHNSIDYKRINLGQSVITNKMNVNDLII